MSDRYFIRRDGSVETTFEEEYWGVVEDPDGGVRDRRKERELFLEDAAEEIAFLRALAPGRILDVGCGLGFLLSALQESWERHGVEVSEFATQHAAEWGAIHHGELSSAGYPDAYFDVVVLYHVIEHMPDPIAALRKVGQILKPGGVLLIGTPNFDSGCARLFGARYRLLHDRTHISLFNADSVHRLLRDHGFVIDRVEFPYFETRHFTRENLLKMFDNSSVSPPFYGNFMTFYAHKPACPSTVSALQRLGLCGREELKAAEHATSRFVDDMAELLDGGAIAEMRCASGGETFLNVAVETFQFPLAPVGVEVVPSREEGKSRELSLAVLIRGVGTTQFGPGETPEFVVAPEGVALGSVEEARVLRVPMAQTEVSKISVLMVIEALGRDLAQRLHCVRGRRSEDGGDQ